MSKEKLPGSGRGKSPEGPSDSFDPIKTGNESWDLVNNLKKEVYEAGIAPGTISNEWSKVRDLNQSVQRTINEYREAGSDKASLRKKIEQQIAELQDDAVQGVRSVLSERIASKNDESSRELTEAEKDLQRKEIREKIAKLENEAQRSSQLYDPENRIESKVLALEDQLHELEGSTQNPESRKEQQEALKLAVEAVVLETRKDTKEEKVPEARQNHPVPQAEIEKQIEELAEERTAVKSFEEPYTEQRNSTPVTAAAASLAAAEIVSAAAPEYDGSQFFNPFIEKASGGRQRPWGAAFSNFNDRLQARENRLSPKGKDAYQKNGKVALRSVVGALVLSLMPSPLGDGHVVHHRPHKESAAPAPKPITEHLSISEKDGNVTINDADQLIGHFAQKLQADYSRSPNTTLPPAVKTFFKTLETQKGASLLHGEDKASFFNFKFENKSKSTVMHAGDTISLNDKGEIVLYKSGHPDQAHVLIDKTGTKVTPVTPKEWKMKIPTRRIETPKQTSKQAVASITQATTKTSTTPVVEPSIALNQAQASANGLPTNNATQTVPETTSPEAPQAAAPVSSSTKEASPAAPTEASPAPASSVPENLPSSVRALTTSDVWSRFNQLESASVFSSPANAGTAEAGFRENLFSVLRDSGIAPDEDESIEHYATRAAGAIREHLSKGMAAFETHPVIYETADNHLRVHGGDVDAQIILAREYVTQINPNAEVIVEDREAKTPLFIVSGKAIQEAHYPAAEGKLAGVIPTSKKIF
jgi:hypothetical protein